MVRWICTVVMIGSLIAPGSAAEPTRPPNILFIYIEDWGYMTGERAAREPNAAIAGLNTPNINAFAKNSITFTRAFCGQSVCSPSKAAILSGLAPHANGIWRNVHNNHPKLGGPEKWIPLPNPLTKENDPTFLAVPGMHDDLTNMIQLFKTKGIYCGSRESCTFNPPATSRTTRS